MKKIWQNKRINFIGDSITFGAGSTICYSDILKEELGLEKANNYGVSGSCITPLCNRTDSFIERYQEMEKDVDLVLVMGGTNDYGRCEDNIAVKFGEFSDRSPDTFYGALHILIQGLINTYTKEKIVFILPPRRLSYNGEESDALPNPVNGHPFIDFIIALEEVTAHYQLKTIDLYRNLEMNPSDQLLKEKYMPDGLHPNEAGHQLMAAYIKNYLLTQF